MSHHAWESGTIVLPSVAVKPLRDQLNATLNANRDALWVAAKLVSVQLRKTKVTESHTLSFVIGDAVTAAGVRSDPERRWRAPRISESQLEDLQDVLRSTWNPATGRFRTVVTADLDRAVGAKGTSRTNRWSVGGEASITLDGRNLRWGVQENNHSVERAHEHPLGAALFSQLDRITWTRGTGGELVGNDEYNQDSRDFGGGGNYVTHSWSFKTKAQQAAALADRFVAARRYSW